MKKLLGYLLLTTIIHSIFACSPVQFNQNKTACTIDNPCIKGGGLLHVGQSVNFQYSNKVDILVVNDNSYSMSVEQQNLASPLNGFIRNLSQSGIDWQIGVTTTDVCADGDLACLYPSLFSGAQGRMVGPPSSSPRSIAPVFGSQYIVRPSSTAETTFANIIQRRSEIGSGDERAIVAARMAIARKDSENAGLFRDASNLAVVILSDEDERSVSGNSSQVEYKPLEDIDDPTKLIQNVHDTWGGQKSLYVYSIVIPPNDTACYAIQKAQGPKYTANYGHIYASLANMTGGKVGSICDNGAGSFANMLQGIAGAITEIPSSKVITLAHVPEAQPVVTFTPAQNAVSYAWTPGSSEISLAVRPANGTIVNVEYDYKQ